MAAKRKLSKTRKHHILYKLARHYQDKPKLFDFMEIFVPTRLNEKCCPLGFIGRELGYSKNAELEAIASEWFGVEPSTGTDMDFYDALSLCSRDEDENWEEDVQVCIKALRKYAREIKAENMI